MEILAIIPARGGSKGVIRKNIRMVGGKPLMAFSIEQAIESKNISRVIVSTEDEEIASVAKKYGAEIPFMRPMELAGDFSTDLEVFQHALNWLNENENYCPDVVVQLRPTCPLRKVNTIDSAIEKFCSQKNVDSLRSLVVASQTPFKMWLINEDGLLSPIVKSAGGEETSNIPRQNLPIAYWQCGFIDIIKPNVILEKNSMMGKNIYPFVIEEQIVDVDYEEDILELEKILAQKEKGKNVSSSKFIRHPS